MIVRLVGEIELKQLLEAVEDFPAVSLQLLALELAIPAQAIEPTWREALDAGLLALHAYTATGEAMYVLTPRGRIRLHDLRPG